MKLGILNQLLSPMGLETRFAGSCLKPEAAQNGDPLKGQLLKFDWKAVRDQQIALTVKLPEKAFVDTVRVELGQSTRLTSAVLAESGRILYQHNAETGKTVTDGILDLRAGIVTDCLELRLTCDFSGIEVRELTLFGAVEDGIDLFPFPKEGAVTGEPVPAARFETYWADSWDGYRAGAVLAEKFREKTGLSLKPAEDGSIRFETDPTVETNGYRLEIRDGAARIRAADLRGMVCGAECFIKLTQGGSVPCCNVSDGPDRPFRGVHIYLPAEDQMEFARRLVKYLISPMGYNAVIIEVGAGMRFDSHPEVNEAFEEAVAKCEAGAWPQFPHKEVAGGKAVDKETVRQFVEYIRGFGIEVIPEIQSLGHVQYLTLAHPEIAEREDKNYNQFIDTRGEDARPDEFYAHCYCPSNERSYEILFDMMDEILEVFRPKEYVHMGHDEVYQIGICPKCAGKDPAQLYAEDVSRIHRYLADRGLKMMIWSDMLQPCSQYKTPPAIDRIPKDILMLDFIWYFHPNRDIEDNLLGKGFRVAAGNLYSSHYPRYESRMAKKGMVGGEISMWVGTTQYALQKEGKFYDIFQTAQLLWNADSFRHGYDLVCDRMICRQMPELRENLRNIRYPSRMDGAQCVVLAENPITFPPAEPARDRRFEADQAFDSLVLYHTCLRKMTREPWTDLQVVGCYILRFDDGSEERIEVTSGGNIGYWNRRQNEPLRHQTYRHNGYTAGYDTDAVASKTPDGGDVTVYRLEHLLNPQKKLVSVQLTQDPALDPQIFLCRAEGVRVKQ